MDFIFCEINFENQKLLFDNPQGIIETYKLSEIPECFNEIEKAVKKGFYLAGFLSYEAGYSFEKTLTEKDVFDFPLLCFGVYPHLTHQSLRFGPPSPSKWRGDLLTVDFPLYEVERDVRVSEAHRGQGEAFNLTKSEYFSKINAIKDYISSGDTYQITFCVKKKFNYDGDPYVLYQKLLDFQPVPYPAYIQHKDFSLLSLSPEMFLKKKNGAIAVKPMKGTLIRDGKLLNDIFGGLWLHFDPKNRAENVMIADLLRNDLGRICDKGTVKTTKLFEVAKYRTVFQMTSTVAGKLDEGIPFYDIFHALFPSGSVTGAPKIRSMEIIRELEAEERRIYTGAIGHITPNRDMFFNVPIRTILLPKEGNGEMGIGGGITWYSTPEGEYDECLIKARFLEAA